MAERETLECDVLIVGGGIAGLSCAIRVLDLAAEYDRQNPHAPIGKPNVLVLEKGPSVGAHILSGAVLDPRPLRELLPNWDNSGAPIKQKVTKEEVAWLTPSGKIPVPPPLVPPYLHNEGNYIVSLGEVAQWLAKQAKSRGVEILEGVAGSQLILEGNVVRGVICNDTGVDKAGKQTANYTPGALVKAGVTVFAEGVRGSLTKQLVHKLRLDVNRNPQVYSLGIKELWEIKAGTFPAGQVVHTLGYPLQKTPMKGDIEAFGGSFFYGLDDTHMAVGLVVGLDYHDPSLDPHNEFNKLKLHPSFKPIFETGKMLGYGAKALPDGGYYSMPRFYGDGFVMLGDAASFLNPARLKGAHLAMKSGLLAAEAIVEALGKKDFSLKRLGKYEDLFQTSWAKEELYASRNWRAGYTSGLVLGGLNDFYQQMNGGKGFTEGQALISDPESTELLEKYHVDRKKPERVKPDGKITFDKVTDVFHSGSVHGEHQPCHLVVPDSNICINRCTVEFANPCQHFCPAGVYEWIPPKPTKEFGAQFGEHEKGHLQINAGNCVHCKTCDIKDPYFNITWVTPEGGDGPRYQRL